jgi:putative ABC transport system substrate-binding protein
MAARGARAAAADAHCWFPQHSASRDTFAPFVNAFRDGLKEAGFVEGQNVWIEYRWAYGQYDRLRALATDLVNRQVNLIAATGGDISAQAAKMATTTIPVVFSISGDPVKAGLVASLNRPGGNLTGRTNFGSELTKKRLQLLHELVPNADHVALLINPKYPITETELEEMQVAAPAVGVQVSVLTASSEHEIDIAFASLARSRIKALFVQNEPYFLNRRDQIVTLAARHALPAMYHRREIVLAGGLISYGSRLTEAYHDVGIYSGRILKGGTSRRVAGPTADQIRSRPESQDRQDARHRNSANAACPRRRGDRVISSGQNNGSES